MKRILITVCLFACLVACSSDESQTPETQNENFYALTVGNSWVYRWYGFYSNGTNSLSQSDVIESHSIIGTEEIDGNLFYKFKKIVSGNDELGGSIGYPYSGEYYEYYRDSLGYLINELGDVKFVHNTNEEFTLYEQESGFVHSAYAQLSDGNYDFTTDAGTFDCLEMRIRYEHEDNIIPAINRHYYADGIGLIKDEIVFAPDPNGSGHQRRLESYNIQ